MEKVGGRLIIDIVLYLRFKISQPLAYLRELRCRNQVVIQILHHDASKFYVFLLFDTIGQRSVYALWTEADTKLPDDEITSGFEQLAICRKKL